MTKNYLSALIEDEMFASMLRPQQPRLPPNFELSYLAGRRGILPQLDSPSLLELAAFPLREVPFPGATQLPHPWLTWAKPQGRWPLFYSALSSAPDLKGVYLIWRESDRRVVRLGQGFIRSRLTDHWWDDEVMASGQGATMFATWALVPSDRCGRIERFLADHYQPIVGERFPDVAPLQVNLPS